MHALQVFFNSAPLFGDYPLSALGVKEWSVVDVVIEAEQLPPKQIPIVSSGCASYLGTLTNHPDYEFSFGELRDVKRLTFMLGRRFTGE